MCDNTEPEALKAFDMKALNASLKLTAKCWQFVFFNDLVNCFISSSLCLKYRLPRSSLYLAKVYVSIVFRETTYICQEHIDSMQCFISSIGQILNLFMKPFTRVIDKCRLHRGDSRETLLKYHPAYRRMKQFCVSY